jgi:glutamine synthetase
MHRFSSEIKDNDVKYVDLRFTDPRGKMQHVTMDVSCVDEDIFADGVMFDGSSIAGWKAINESDMVLMPDTARRTSTRSSPRPTHGHLLRHSRADHRRSLRPRPAHHAKKAEAYRQASGIGDTFFGPEAEFFMFDDVRFTADPYNTGFKLDSTELPSNMDTEYEDGQHGPPSAHQGRLLPGPAGRLSARTCAPKCSPSWPKWA